jgi:hypothetical protein
MPGGPRVSAGPRPTGDARPAGEAMAGENIDRLLDGQDLEKLQLRAYLGNPFALPGVWCLAGVAVFGIYVTTRS